MLHDVSQASVYLYSNLHNYEALIATETSHIRSFCQPFVQLMVVSYFGVSVFLLIITAFAASTIFFGITNPEFDKVLFAVTFLLQVRKHLHEMWSRVARWFIYIPKIPFLLYFGRPWKGKFW
jgi:hypothetical protein